MDPQSRIEQKILKYLLTQSESKPLHVIEKSVRIEGLQFIVEDMVFRNLLNEKINAANRKYYSVA